MALIHSFEKSGNQLFRYRGQMPVILFILAVPAIYYSDYSMLNNEIILAINFLAPGVSLTGFIVRSIAIGTTPKGTSGRNRSEQVAESLNVSGIYSVVRHPLYLGNFLMWAGIVIFTYNMVFFFLVSLLFWLYYERIMFAEERFLEKKFGNLYLDWSEKVPAFIPAFGKYQAGQIPFSFKTILRREYSGVLGTAVGFAYVDFLRLFFETGNFEWNRISLYAVAVSIILALVLRTLKHRNMLNEDGRS